MGIELRLLVPDMDARACVAERFRNNTRYSVNTCTCVFIMVHLMVTTRASSHILLHPYDKLPLHFAISAHQVHWIKFSRQTPILVWSLLLDSQKQFA